MSQFSLGRMSQNEVATAIDWAAEEGWNPGLRDAEAFYACDPEGFYVAKVGDDIVGVCSNVCYNQDFAFLGLYIVRPDKRGDGIGMALTKHVLSAAGNRTIGLDAVLEMQLKYERVGFKTAYQNMRYEGKFLLDPVNDTHLAAATDVPFQELAAYDQNYFGVPREAFLHKWISLPGHRSLVYRGEKGIEGYGVIRRCRKGYKLGPLFAESPDVADRLLRALVHPIGKDPFYLDIPQPNPAAVELVKRYDMQPVFETGRMYRGRPLELPLDRIYGVSTLELG